MTDLGLIHSAQSAYLGGYLAADAALSATSLVVDSIVDFSETGGSLTLNGVTYTYTAANFDTNTITLATGLTAAAFTQDRVDVTPTVVEKTALVMVPTTEDALTVLVPHALMDRVPEGIREEGARETVLFDKVDDRFVITDILGKRPVIDGSFIDSTTLPASPSDGLPPSSSPTPTATGGIGAVLVRWTPIANHDTVTYSLYGDTTTGFTPGSGNLLVQTTGSSYTHRPASPDYTATYYYKLIASDVDGAAAASAEASAQLVQVTGPDVAADYVYAGTIVVDQLTGGTLAADVLLSSTITTRGGGTGAGLDINETLTRYDSAGTASAILGDTNSFKGTVEADGLTVTGTAAFRSTTNEISKGGAVTLQTATSSPAAAPSAVVGWSGTYTEAIFSGNYGLHWTGTDFATAGDSAPPLIQRATGTDVALPLNDPRPAGGVIQVGTDWITLGVIGDVWYLTRYNSSGVKQVQTAYTPLYGTWDSGGSLANFLAPASIGVDHVNPTTSFMVAEYNEVAQAFRTQRRVVSTLAITETLSTTANSGFHGPVVGVARGNFDFGSTRIVILSRAGFHHWVFNATTGAYDGNEAFATPSPGSMSGFAWDGTRFWSTNAKSAATGTAQVYKHSTYIWYGADPKTHYDTLTWRDTNATGGTHETDMGQAGSFPMKKRATVTLTSPTIPSGGTDDPNAVSFYLGTVNTTRTNLWRQTLPADGVNTLTVGDAITFAGTNPPTTNDFPDSAPGNIKTAKVDGSGNPHLLIEGDGDIFRGANAAMLLTQNLSAACSALVNLTTTEVDITGATLTFTTTRPNARYFCIGSFYFGANTGSGNVGSGKLSVDGSVQSAKANFTGISTNERASVAQTWIGTLASAGSHTLKLRGVMNAGSGFTVNATDTTITVMIFE